LLGVLVATLLLYWPCLDFEFVWDDDMFLVDNENIASLENIPAFFYDETTVARPEDDTRVFRPLRNTIWAVGYRLWGLDPTGYHAANLCVHLLNVALLFWVLRGLHVGSARAAVAAGLFAAHPLGTEAVSWIKAIDDLMVTSCFLAAAGLAVRWSRRLLVGERGLPYLLALWALLTLAVLSKESGVVLPGLVGISLLLSVVVKRPDSVAWLASRRPVQVFFAGAVLLDCLYIAWRSRVLGELAQLEQPLAVGWSLFWTQLRATAKGVLLVVWPWDLNADYLGFGVSQDLDLRGLAALALILVLVAAAAVTLWLRRGNACWFAVAWWFLVILPVSNLVPTMQFLAERFFYAGVAGVAIACGWFLGRTAPESRATLIVLLMTAVLALGTSRRIAVWQSEETLFESVVAADPANPRGLENYALALYINGRYAASREVLDAVEAVEPDSRIVAFLEEDLAILVPVEHEIADLLRRAEEEPFDADLQWRMIELSLRAARPKVTRLLVERLWQHQPKNWRSFAALAVAAAHELNHEDARRQLALAQEALAASGGDLGELDRWRLWAERLVRGVPESRRSAAR
jgi:hypothetical protein